MAYAKARVDFSEVQDGDLKGIAQAVHDLMLVTNIATFTGTPYTAAAFQTIIDAWDDSLSKAQYKGSDRIATKNSARATLEEALFELGTFVNLKAKGDQLIVDQSGFPSYTTERTPSGDVTFVPQNVRWEEGTLSGQAVLRWRGDGTRSNYEVQTCTSDPNVEANWSYRGSFSGGRAVLDGFTSGSKPWGRVRKIGIGGKVGGWSDPAQTMVK